MLLLICAHLSLCQVGLWAQEKSVSSLLRFVKDYPSQMIQYICKYTVQRPVQIQVNSVCLWIKQHMAPVVPIFFSVGKLCMAWGRCVIGEKWEKVILFWISGRIWVRSVVVYRCSWISDFYRFSVWFIFTPQVAEHHTDWATLLNQKAYCFNVSVLTELIYWRIKATFTSACAFTHMHIPVHLSFYDMWDSVLTCWLSCTGWAVMTFNFFCAYPLPGSSFS